jgi:hypothetical protein
MIALRFMPLSGYHGAEHQVVHAIERGEDLIPEVVRRMPRVHPRCGTNLAVGASLFFYLGTAEWIVEPELRLLVAVAVTLLLWKRLGNFLQQYVTTKVPTDHQLDMGIRSGKEFLRAYESAKVIKPTGAQRIIATGMSFVVIGTTLAYAVIALLAYLLGYGELVGV